MASIFDTVREKVSNLIKTVTPTIKKYGETYSKISPYVPFAPQVITPQQIRRNDQEQIIPIIQGAKNFYQGFMESPDIYSEPLASKSFAYKAAKTFSGMSPVAVGPIVQSTRGITRQIPRLTQGLQTFGKVEQPIFSMIGQQGQRLAQGLPKQYGPSVELGFGMTFGGARPLGTQTKVLSSDVRELERVKNIISTPLTPRNKIDLNKFQQALDFMSDLKNSLKLKIPDKQWNAMSADAQHQTLYSHIKDLYMGGQNFGLSVKAIGDTMKAEKSKFKNPQDPFYNIDRLNISRKAKEALKGKVVGEFKPKIERVVGKKLTNEEVIQHAKAVSDDLIKQIGRQNTVEFGAAQLRLRQTIANMMETGRIDRNLLEKLIADKSFSQNTARLMQQRVINANPMSPNAKLLNEMLRNILDLNHQVDDILVKAKGVDFNNPNQAANFYRQFVKPNAGDWIDKLRFNSMLTSPTTHVVNAVSNLQGTGIIEPIQKTLEGGIDFMLSAINPNRQRTRFTGEGGAYAKAYYGELKNAFVNMVNVLSGKQFGQYPDINNIPLTRGGVAGKVESLLDVGGKALMAADEFFKTLTMAGMEASGRYRIERLGSKIDKSLLSSRAAQETEELLFRQDFTKQGGGIISNLIGVGGKYIKSAQYSQNPIFRWMAKLTLPFVKIGTNLAKTGFEFNPVTGSINMIGNDDKIAQAAKVMIGSAVTALTVPFALKGDLTFGSPPANTKRGELSREGNIPPYSIKINNKWVSYSKLHPAIAWQLGMVAALTGAMKDGKITDSSAEKIMEGGWSWLRFGLDQTYYRNVSDLINGLNGDLERFSSIPANYISQFIPFRAFASWLNRAIDQYQRKPDTDASFAEQTAQQLMSRLPILSQNVPIRTDSRGQPMTYSNRFINMVSPYTVNTERQPMADQYRELVQTEREIAPLKEELKQSKKQEDMLWNTIAPLSLEERKIFIKQKLQSGELTVEQFKKDILPKLKEEAQNKQSGVLSPAQETIKGLPIEQEAKYYIGKTATMSRAEKGKYFLNLYKTKTISKETLIKILQLDKQQERR